MWKINALSTIIFLFRYPFLISEILGAENENLINFLFEKPAENS